MIDFARLKKRLKTADFYAVMLGGTVIHAGTGDKFFPYTQGVAAKIWTVTHNLGKFPSVSINNSLFFHILSGNKFFLFT
jgi:hypothetical protein